MLTAFQLLWFARPACSVARPQLLYAEEPGARCAVRRWLIRVRSPLLAFGIRPTDKRSAKLSQFVIHRGLIIAIMQAVFSAVYYFAPVALYQVEAATGCPGMPATWLFTHARQRMSVPPTS